MKSYFSFIVIVFLLVSCGISKRNFFGGLENLKWNSDVTEVKDYMENKIKAEFAGYKINRAEKTMSMFFTGSKFAGIDVRKWEIKLKEGKFFEYKITLPTENNTFQRILKTLKNKLDAPDKIDGIKYFWKRIDEDNQLVEKIILRKFEDAILLSVELTEK